jgi:hypothetical protein
VARMLVVALLAVSTAAFSDTQSSTPVERHVQFIAAGAVKLEYSPAGEVPSWSMVPAMVRLGNGSSALLTTTKQLSFQRLVLPPGSYTLFLAVDASKSWHLVVSRNTNISGPYKFGEDLGWVVLQRIDQANANNFLTMTLEESANDKRGGLTIVYGNKGAGRVPFSLQ